MSNLVLTTNNTINLYSLVGSNKFLKLLVHNALEQNAL